MCGYSELQAVGVLCAKSSSPLGNTTLAALWVKISRRPQRRLIGRLPRHVRLRPLRWAHADESERPASAQASALPFSYEGPWVWRPSMGRRTHSQTSGAFDPIPKVWAESQASFECVG